MPQEVEYERPTCTGCAIHWGQDAFEKYSELEYGEDGDVVAKIDCPNCGTENTVHYDYVKTVLGN